MTVENEHFDVVVVGAGISGIGAGYHLQTSAPTARYAILEGRADIGGTWDLFRYPGVRSDSDMHTLGYSFKPWTAAKAIADGPSILAYLRETVAEFGIDRHIRFNHLVSPAEWSTDDARWTLDGRAHRCGRHRADHVQLPVHVLGLLQLPGRVHARVPGHRAIRRQVVHPQAWPDDLDYAGKRVVVIGSGATAMTLVPAMAETAAHVTMLQRSPTYVVSRPDQDAIANRLRKVLPDGLAYDITRLKNITLQQVLLQADAHATGEGRSSSSLGMVRKEIGDDYDVDTHFTPRTTRGTSGCASSPTAICSTRSRSGKASVVTDTIDTFTETGIRLASGDELDGRHHRDGHRAAAGDARRDGLRRRRRAGRLLEDVDLQGLRLLRRAQPGVVVRVHQRVVDVARRPHLRVRVSPAATTWSETGTVQCTPRLRRVRRRHARADWIENFSSGYMQRVMHLFPKQGDREPWINPQNYSVDKKMFRKGAVDDGVMQFERAKVPAG